jgi:cellulose synthase operon protein C
MMLALSIMLFVGQLDAVENPLTSKEKEKRALVEKLRRDIFKVDRSIGETDKLIAKSRNAPYLPDLQFRLAELYVEKSRYVYFLQAETRAASEKGAIVSPETKLLKQKAVQIYTRILREFSEFRDGDKVTFYLAHEQRELGDFETMLKTLGELIKKYPSSPLRLDSEQIVGDYYFDKADLKVAEEHYRAILDAPPTPVHDLARYKMGWIRVNQSNHNEAVTFFEAAAASSNFPGVDAQKALSVKREALLDLVYSYTEARAGKTSIQYFEKLSDSRATFALALDKLSNRYFIKQQYEFAIPAFRRLLEVQPDPENDVERVGKLYDAIKGTKGKVLPKPEDLGMLARTAVQLKVSADLDEVTRKKGLVELEEMARDLSTSIHTQAQKKEDKALYLDAAEAYAKYLSLFRPKQVASIMMQNRADALFAAKRFPESARQFEELARTIDTSAPEAKSKTPPEVIPLPELAKPTAGTKTIGGDAKSHAEALYGALLAHYSALKTGEVERLNAFEVADSRNALKSLGALFIARYPQNENALEVKFNIARAFYEDGEYKKSAELFKDFALKHTAHKDAVTAANLAFDSLRQLNDFKSIEAFGKEFLASALPESFKADTQKMLTQSKSEALGELALKSSEETGDVVTGLMKVAEENKGQEIGEKALYGAFSAAREKRDFKIEREIGDRFIKEYSKSQYLSDVMNTLARQAAEAGRFDDAAAAFENLASKFQGDSLAVDSLLSAARLRTALGDYANATRLLELTAEQAGARKGDVLAQLAQTHLKAGSAAKARATADQALKVDKTNALAASIVAEVANASGTEKAESFVPMMTTVTNSPNGVGDEAARGLWHVGDMAYREFKTIGPDRLEEKVAVLQQLQALFQQSASMGSPEWAVASLWRIANGLQNIADTAESMPVPAGLKAAEVEQFRAAIKNQVEPLKVNAANTYRTCVNRAESLDVFSAAALGCRKQIDSATSPLRAAGPEKAANLDDLRKKVEVSQSASDFEALGMALLEANHVREAILQLGRVVELEDSRASAHNALGFAYLLNEDPNAARAEYGRALDSDPTYEKARANLAALKCRYADVEGAKRELSVIKENALTGADVDPEWKSCK